MSAAGYDVAELLWERQRRRYRGTEGDVESQLAGFVAWCADHVKIAHPNGKRPFEMRPPQLHIARGYLTNRRTLILKARQIGFTTLTMNFCLWRVLFYDDFSIINLSRKEDDAKAALGMAKMAYDQLPTELQAKLPMRLDNNASRMTFSNGSYIESHPAANNPARSRTATLFILDEWAFMPDPDDAWAAIAPAADIGGNIIALSTANGSGNTFHTMWKEAVAGDNNFAPIFFPWNAVPERDENWYESQKRSYLPWQLAQEFPSDPEEAFIKSGNPVFDVDLLRAVETEDGHSGRLVGDSIRHRDFRPEEDGPLTVWEMPNPKHLYVIGADVAQGLEHGDYSSADVLNVTTGVQAAHWHGHIDPDLYGEELAVLGWFFRTALVAVEVNNHGLTTAKALQRAGYQNIYFRRRLGSKRETLSEELGWMTTRSTKPLIIDGLNAALRQGELQVLGEGSRQELISYVRKADGSTEGSPHDDRVISLAIAQQMRTYVHERKAERQFVIPKGSFEWELQRIRREEEAANTATLVLGRNNVRTRSRT